MLSDTYVAACIFPTGDMQVVQDRQPLTYTHAPQGVIFGNQTCQAPHITVVRILLVHVLLPPSQWLHLEPDVGTTADKTPPPLYGHGLPASAGGSG